MRHPVDAGARQRLLEAQRAETEALRKVETAGKGCAGARDRLAAADAKLLEAQRSLVHTSGVTRAALLLGTDGRRYGATCDVPIRSTPRTHRLPPERRAA